MLDLPNSKFWSQIDAALVVNLKHRTDRWERIHTILRRHLPEDKIVRIDAVLGVDLPGYNQPPWFRESTPERVAKVKAGAAGCCLSHRKAIQTAKDAGYQRVLLLEDDADFYDELNTTQGDAVADVLEDDSAWDMFYLGFYQKLNKYHTVKSLSLDGKPFEIRRIRGPLYLHALVLNHRIFDRMLEELPEADDPWRWMTYWGSIDSWVQNRLGRDPGVRIWATEPKLVMQAATFSDIGGRMVSVEEGQGTHIRSTQISLDQRAFNRSIPLSPLEKLQQAYKRRSRVLKAKLFGYKKT